jgi:heterodisulfide reductase subunit B
MRLSYYPGCSLHSTAKEYAESVEAICSELGIELSELSDWNCCGASAAHSIDRELSLKLCARNLEMAEEALAVPCSACYYNIKKAEEELNRGVKVMHILEVLHKELSRVREMAKRPLERIKVAPYYGCLITRANSFESREHPKSMDELLSAVGADVVSWSFKSDCCGASLSLSAPKVVTGLVERLINQAKRAGAECIATACPLCQVNLEMRQNGADFPIFYFTELIGIGLKMNPKSWLKRHIVNPFKLMEGLLQ